MKKELDKVYSPQENEDEIYKKWEKSGYFNPDNLNLSSEAPSYTIVLPPPNITAKLHIGHSAMLAIEDLLIRYHRLKGERTLWVPGTDHAAIATQNAVEKKLLKETGKTRHDFGREKFLNEVWKFVEETQALILRQTKKMGASLDWDRLAFTLDAPRQEAVKKMFIDMYEAGAIYRGERIVNWCPRCQSTLADDEVEYQEQPAKLYTFKYDKNFPITISTTRPETKLGDTAVAVNQKDERYKQYIGKEYQVSFCGQALKIKIISDRNVEPEFGTGALGVTPAHSIIDWQMAEKNDLEIVKVIDEQGKIRDGFGKYSGLSVMAAREKIVDELRKSGLLEKEEDIVNNLSLCYRCESPIEPLPSKQWFVAVDKKLECLNNKSLKEKAIEAAQKTGETSAEIEFIPNRFTKRYLDWMENLHDWCVSRQIWFGHQIPAWYRMVGEKEEIFVGENTPDGEGWTQDTDTLDTWFSSGMWTFSTLGWPDNFKDGKKSGDLTRFHPTQVLETGYEILTLWVSRMIMMSFFAIGEIPFQKVYLHGTILDKHGKKMSKSKGNGVDPLEIIESYGADALRLSLLMGATPGNDSRFSEEKVEAKRNFINKLWNISRFILSSTDEKFYVTANNKLPKLKTASDKWIVWMMNNLIEQVSVNLENFDFSLAAETLTSFTWDALADWYLEIAKVEKDKEEILIYLLKNLLILWHPFIPFVTEKIWSGFGDDAGKLLIIEPWPESSKDKKIENKEVLEFSKIIKIIQKIRELRAENKIEPKNKIKALIYAHDNLAIVKSQALLIQSLRTNLSELEIKESGDQISEAIGGVVEGMEIFLFGGVDKEKERARLTKEKANLEKVIALQEQKLANSDFVSRAPATIVEAEKNKLANYKDELEKIVKINNAL
ncbi:MAG: valine--tRNA ligase [Patescibacteria group bacterium]